MKRKDAVEKFVLRGFPITERLRIDDIFGRPGELEVELGAGDGSFLVAYARAHSELNILGVERLLGRLRKIDRKAARAGLENVRLLRMEAAYLVQFLLPPAMTKAFHIYFPDPWPKRRHWKHRLVNDAFTEMIRGALARNGEVHLRTDDAPYFEQMIEVFGRNLHFEKVETPPELLAVETDFERGFRQRGVSTRSASYRKID